MNLTTREFVLSEAESDSIGESCKWRLSILSLEGVQSSDDTLKKHPYLSLSLKMLVLDTGNLAAANSSATSSTCSPPAKPGLYHSWQTVALARKVGFEGDCGQHVPDLASTDIAESGYLTWLWQCLDFISGMCSMFFCV